MITEFPTRHVSTRMPHVWTVLTLILGGLALAKAQLVGHVKLGGVTSMSTVDVQFGWPLTYMWRNYVRQPRNIWEWFALNGDASDPIRPDLLAADIVLSLVIVAGAAIVVERVCRRLGPQANFDIASLFAFTGWFGTIFATEVLVGAGDLMVWNLVMLLRLVHILVLGFFWFFLIGCIQAAANRMINRPN